MKKMILSLIGAAFVCTGFAANCVTTTQLSTDYATRTVTFELTWTGCNAASNHFNKVWCFVDVRAVGSSSWTRATISGTPAVDNGTYAAGNAAGFYVTGTNGQSATVTVKLGNAPEQFSWCAFATDYPPNVSALAGAVNTLKGAPSFVVNGNTVAGNQFTGVVNSLTDATGCPGCVGRDVAANTNVPCCANLTAVGGYCRNLVADNAWADTQQGLEIMKNPITDISLCSSNTICPKGWRLPTYVEIEKFNTNRVAIFGAINNTIGMVAGDYGCQNVVAACQNTVQPSLYIFIIGNYGNSSCGIWSGFAKWCVLNSWTLSGQRCIR